MGTLKNLNWDDIRIFLCVARAGAISRAARSMGMDHSTISRHVTQFEYDIGASVFERTSSGLVLNRLGHDLLAHAEDIENGILRMEAGLDTHDKGVVGTVRIAMMEGISSLYLSRRLQPLIDRHPQLTLEIATSPHHVQVSRREADVFLSFFRAEAKSVVSKKIGAFSLGLFASDAYLARNGTPQSVEDLRNHRFVEYVRDLIHVDPVRWLDEVITNPETAITSSSMITQMGCAAGGMGLVLLPYFAVEREPNLRRVLDGQINVQRDVWLTVHNDLKGTRRIRAIGKYIEDLLRTDEAYLFGKGPSRTGLCAVSGPDLQTAAE